MKFYDLVKQSLFREGKPSSSRIFSYVMMSAIWMFAVTFIAIEIGNAAIEWKKGIIYIPSWEVIAFFGMCLAHQLTLLGIYKKAELNIPNIPTKGQPVKTDEDIA